MAISLDLKNLNEAISAAAGDLEKVGKVVRHPSLFPGPGIIGLVIREANFDQFSAVRTNAIAEKLAGDVGEPVTLLRDKSILVGFFPKNVIEF